MSGQAGSAATGEQVTTEEVSTMICPDCGGSVIATQIRSVAIERPDGAWRHYHALCCDCGARLWWNAHPGDTSPIVKSGAHSACTFFKPADT